MYIYVYKYILIRVYTLKECGDLKLGGLLLGGVRKGWGGGEVGWGWGGGGVCVWGGDLKLGGLLLDMYPPPHMTHVSSSSYDTCILLLI